MVENENVPPSSINVISQYNAQCTALREESVNTGIAIPIVSTVVASQGYYVLSVPNDLLFYMLVCLLS